MAPQLLRWPPSPMRCLSSTSSVVKGSVSAAVMAWMSRSRPLVKERRRGRPASRALVIHRWSPASFSRGGSGIPAKEPIRAVRAVISGQEGSRRARNFAWPPARRSGLVSRIRAARRGDRCGRPAVEHKCRDHEMSPALVGISAALGVPVKAALGSFNGAARRQCGQLDGGTSMQSAPRDWQMIHACYRSISAP